MKPQMQKILVNYATSSHYGRQRLNALSAIARGGVDRYVSYRPHHLDREFVKDNSYLLKHGRGGGLWVWKPYIILHALSQAAEEDVIIYCDSDSVFVDTIGPMVDVCRELTDGVLGFEVSHTHLERHWTKRDAFVIMDCDRSEFRDTPQMRGGQIILVNRPASREFVRQWANLTCQARLVSDLPSVCDEAEHEDFIAHRHDQSLFSLLYKSHGYLGYGAIAGSERGFFLAENLKREPSFLELLTTYMHPHMYLKGGRPRSGNLGPFLEV
jgi:hypothetical protein